MSLNIAQYASLPTFDVRSGVALGVAVISAVPPNAPEVAKDAARTVRTSVVALQAGWAAREAVERGTRRPADLRLDRAWASLHKSLDGASGLEGSERGAAAKRVLSRVFSNGLAFTNLPFRKQWAESERLLQLIDDAELEAAITQATGGPEFMAELRAAHHAYGQVLNVTEAATQSAEVNLRDRLLDLRSALSSYAVQIVAWSHTTGADEDAARSAVRPIDVVRAVEARRRRTPSTPVAPEDPQTPADDEVIPEVTPETPVPVVN